MMETILKAYGIWETIVAKEGVTTNEKKENTSKAIIFQTLPQDVLMQVAQYSTAKEFKGLGETLEDKVLVRKLLNFVPKKFLPIVATIEQYQDLDEISFEEAVGRLTAYEERIKSQDTLESNDQDKLLMASSNNKSYGKWRSRDFNKEAKESMKWKNNPKCRSARRNTLKINVPAIVIKGENIGLKPNYMGNPNPQEKTVTKWQLRNDNCHYALSITRGVVLAHHLVENGFIQRFKDFGISVSKNNVHYFNAIPSNGIYEIDMHDLVPNVNSIYNVSTKRAKHNLNSTYLWHYRLAHISKKPIEKLQQEGLLKSTDNESFDQCVSCLSGKITRKSFPHRPKRATDLLGIIHTNVCG
ncbi:zinc finger, CCHC-type containing protein [Tanacetum coccineum]